MTTNNALVSAKKAFRNLVKQSLSTLTTEAVNSQSNSCVKSILSLPEYKDAKSISVYLSIPDKEVQTRMIIEDAFSSGKTVYVPYIYRPASVSSTIISTTASNAPRPPTSLSPSQIPLPPPPPKSLIDMFSLYSLDDYHSLKPDPWGIPSLSKESIATRKNCLEQGLDLIIVPGVAFGVDFRRLGHGKGYYDYFLSRYKEAVVDPGCSKMPVLVGTGLTPQIHSTEAVPVDESDWLVDILVIGDGRCLRRE